MSAINKPAVQKKSSTASAKTPAATISPPKASTTTTSTSKSPRKQTTLPLKKSSTTAPKSTNSNASSNANSLKNTGKSPSFASVKISSKFNIAEIKLLRDYFSEMDEDNDGVVSRRQFRMAHGKKKKETEKEQFPFLSDSFFDMVDSDGSETITFREFLKAIYPATTKQERDVVVQYKEQVAEEEKELTNDQKEELTAIFRMYDKDGSGNLTFSELRHAVSDLGMNKEEVEKMFLSLDTNGDNMVSLEEFLEGMKSNYLGEPTTPKTPKPATTG